MKILKKIVAFIIVIAFTLPSVSEIVYGYEEWIDNTTIVLEGIAEVGQTLHAHIGGEEPSGVMFEWYSSDCPDDGNDGVKIPDETSASYIIGSEDVGKYIYVIIKGDGITYEIYESAISKKSDEVKEKIGIDSFEYSNDDSSSYDDLMIQQEDAISSLQVQAVAQTEPVYAMLPESGSWTYQGVTFTENEVSYFHSLWDYTGDAEEMATQHSADELVELCVNAGLRDDESGNEKNELNSSEDGRLPEFGSWTYQGVTFSENEVSYFHSLWDYTGDAAEMVTHHSASELIAICKNGGYYGFYGKPEEQPPLPESAYIVSGSTKYDAYKTGSVLSIVGVSGSAKCTWYRVPDKDKYYDTNDDYIVKKNSTKYQTTKDDAGYYFYAVINNSNKTNLFGAMHNIYWQPADYSICAANVSGEYTDTNAAVLAIEYKRNPYSYYYFDNDVSKVTWYRLDDAALYDELTEYDGSEEYVCGNDFTYKVSDYDIGKYIFAVYERCDTDVRQYKTELIGPIRNIDIESNWIAPLSQDIITGTSYNNQRAVGSILTAKKVNGLTKCTWYKTPSKKIAEDTNSDADFKNADNIFVVGKNYDSYVTKLEDVDSYLFAVYSVDNEDIKYKSNIVGPIYEHDNVLWGINSKLIKCHPNTEQGKIGGLYNVDASSGNVTWYKVSTVDEYDGLTKYSDAEQYVVSKNKSYKPSEEDIGKYIFAVYESETEGDFQYKSELIGPLEQSEELDDYKWIMPNNSWNYYDNMTIVSSAMNASSKNGSVLWLSGINSITRCTWYQVSSKDEYNKLDNYADATEYAVSNEKTYTPAQKDENNYLFAVAEFNGDYTSPYKSKLIENFSVSDNSTAKVTVSFDGNGGTLDVTSMEYSKNGVYYAMPAAYRDNYIFAGWYTAKTGGNNILNGSSITNNKNHKLYAHWKPQYYNISYFTGLLGAVNKGNPSLYYVTSPTISLKNPTRAGYTFDGWYSDSDYTTKVTKITKGSSGDITLYAKWIKNHYSVKFNGNGAKSVTMPAIADREYDSIYQLPYNTFERTGFKFIGWNTKSNGKGCSYIDGDVYSNLSSTNKASVVLYAQWERIPYYIEYHLYGAENHKRNKDVYYVNSGNLRLYNPVKPGYTFLGWYTDADFTNKITRIVAADCKNVELYAKWKPNTYTVKFNANSGIGTAISNVGPCTYGEFYSLPNNTFARNGYTFVGWNTKNNGTGIQVNEGESFYNLATSNKVTVTLYAQWKAIPYYVEYYMDGGNNHSGNPNIYYVNSGNISLKNPTKHGYTFIGWYSDPALTKKVTRISGIMQENIKLYAAWK